MLRFLTIVLAFAVGEAARKNEDVASSHVLAPTTVQALDRTMPKNPPPKHKALTKQQYDGLNPHHAAGEGENNVFKHQFQHVDAVGKLMYYQYEAQRHPHVKVLTAQASSANATRLQCKAWIPRGEG